MNAKPRWIFGVALVPVIIPCLLASPFAPWAGPDDGKAVSAGSKLLSVEQTLGLVFSRPKDSPVIHLYARANPRSLKYARKILGNPAQKEYHGNILILLSYIGDREDVDTISGWVEDLPDEIGHEDRKMLYAMFDAIGAMCRRGVPGSCELLREWREFSYWKSSGRRFQGTPAPGRLPFEYEVVPRLMAAYARSEPADIREVADSLLEKIDDAKIREHVGGLFASAVDLAERKAFRAGESRDPSQKELQWLQGRFNGDLENPAPEGNPGRIRPGSGIGPGAGNAAPAAPIRISLVGTLEELGSKVEVDADGSVTHLDLAGPRVTDAELLQIPRMPKLQGLSIGNASVTDEGIKALARLGPIRRLSIFRIPNLGEPGFSSLCDIQGLEHLALRRSGVSGESLSHLSRLVDLKMLVLSGLKIDDSALRPIGSLRNLERFYVDDVPIRGGGLEHLKGLPKLKILVLRNTRLGDGGLKHIEALAQLEELVLTDTVSDSYKPEFTPEGLERLRRALPNCKISR